MSAQLNNILAPITQASHPYTHDCHFNMPQHSVAGLITMEGFRNLLEAHIGTLAKEKRVSYTRDRAWLAAISNGVTTKPAGYAGTLASWKNEIGATNPDTSKWVVENNQVYKKDTKKPHGRNEQPMTATENLYSFMTWIHHIHGHRGRDFFFDRVKEQSDSIKKAFCHQFVQVCCEKAPSWQGGDVPYGWQAPVSRRPKKVNENNVDDSESGSNMNSAASLQHIGNPNLGNNGIYDANFFVSDDNDANDNESPGADSNNTNVNDNEHVDDNNQAENNGYVNNGYVDNNVGSNVNDDFNLDAIVNFNMDDNLSSHLSQDTWNTSEAGPNWAPLHNNHQHHDHHGANFSIYLDQAGSRAFGPHGPIPNYCPPLSQFAPQNHLSSQGQLGDQQFQNQTHAYQPGQGQQLFDQNPPYQQFTQDQPLHNQNFAFQQPVLDQHVFIHNQVYQQPVQGQQYFDQYPLQQVHQSQAPHENQQPNQYIDPRLFDLPGNYTSLQGQA